MDVIALDRAGIAEVVAPNGTAVTEGQLERMWRLDPAPILCFDGDAAGRKAAIRAATRALPHLAPDRTLRFVELPAGPGSRRPRPLRRPRGARGAARQPRAARPAAVAARARRRAAGHARGPRGPAPAPGRARRAIADPELRRLYRDQWLDRFQAEMAKAARRGANGSRGRRFKPGAAATPRPPARSATPRGGSPAAASTPRPPARSSSASSISRRRWPPLRAAGGASHRRRASSPRCATSWSTRRSPAQALDREALATILQPLERKQATARRSSGGSAFPSPAATRSPNGRFATWASRSTSLAAEEEIDAALHEAPERLMAGEERRVRGAAPAAIRARGDQPTAGVTRRH